MEGIGKCNQRVKEYHIVVIAGKAEWEYHKCIYRYAVWRKGDGYITSSIFAHLVIYIAFPAFDHKFVDFLKEQQSNKRVGQFVGELHEPIKVVTDSEYCKHNGKDNVRYKACKQSHVIAGVFPIPPYSDTHINGILRKRGDEHSQEQECQQTEQRGGCEIGKSIKFIPHYSPSLSSISKAAME